MRIEWPKGSGRVADYTEAELVFIRGFTRQYEAGEISEDELARQIGHFHDLKVEFGLDIATDEPVVAKPGEQTSLLPPEGTIGLPLPSARRETGEERDVGTVAPF